ncbi:hypothetical protein DW083_06050 [Parabacteroides sp. AF48-14]|uniref:hypothetical protein n=1 Tax=Parabacteroides sp. AF48-14 TaxID=2292052 RepID=UPI000EFDB367|nr:hypothetical protein [Parabacteroides sp. AF48-14]RHO73406.1 hypothetical protein DW083_06050 [Parabacteroides sp. AF48-14]
MKNKINRPKAIIEITSFRGISSDAIHFYGKLRELIEFESFELKRPITKEELEKFPDRFYCYEEGDMINAFNSWIDVIDTGANVAKEKGIDLNDIAVDGIPNTERLSYYDAIKPLDIRLKCKKCRKVINPGEGVYNTPRGVFCEKCY